MNYKPKNTGFSLTEVLLAMGTLAVGMIFIAGVFPVGISFTTIAAERTLAAVAADEAFAKIRLYGIYDFNSPPWPSPNPTVACVDFNDVSFVPLNPDEFAYPSTDIDISQKRYFWSALCRYIGGGNVQVTVFVSRKSGAAARYWVWDITTGSLKESFYPVPVSVSVSQPAGFNPDELLINDLNPTDPIDELTFINDGYTIVDNETGQIYRVLERYADDDRIILLDRRWEGGPAGWVWVVPPAVDGGRYPCIAVYQKVIRF